MVSCKIMKSKNQFWHILKTCSCGSPWSSSSCGWLRSGCTHKRCHQGWYMVFIFHSNQNSKIISFIFQTSPVSEVLETIQPPLHQAYHSGPTHNLNRFLLPISFRPRPEDPKSTLIHFQHGGSGNWMPLFKRFKLFLKVCFFGKKPFGQKMSFL